MFLKHHLTLLCLAVLFAMLGISPGHCAVTPGQPVNIAFSTPPNGVIIRNDTFAVAVLVTDANAAGVSGVSVALTKTAGTGTLSGTLSATTNSSGIATFSGLGINATGIDKVLTAAAGALSVATSPFSILDGTLNFDVQPADTQAGQSIAPSIQVSVVDSGANPVPGANVTIGLNSGNGPLNGTKTQVTNRSGVAVFAGLSIDAAGTKVLQAKTGASTGLSDPFQINPGSLASLTFTTQPPASTPAGAAFSVVVAAADSLGNAITGASITLSKSSGSGTLSGTLNHVSDLNGNVAFNGLSIDLSGAKQLTASSGAVSQASNTFAITGGAVTTLTFSTQPPASNPVGAPFTVAVMALDSASNPVSGATVTLALTAGTGTLSGTAAGVTDGGGIATFTGLSINLVGANKQLTASAGGKTQTSNIFAVVAGAVNTLTFSTPPPASTTANGFFSAGVTATDSGGNVVSGAVVSLALTAGTGTLSGTKILVTDSFGVAQFDNLSIDKAGANKQLTATSSAVNQTSALFSITGGTAAALTFSRQPPVSTPSGTAFQVKVLATDAGGNPVSGVSVTLTKTSGTGTLSGAGAPVLTDATGVAAFSGLTIDKIGSDKQLTATDGSNIQTSAVFTITTGAAATLAFTTQPPGSVAANAPFMVVVTARDSGGNPVSGDTVNLTLSSGSGTLAGTLSAITDASGVAAFNGLTIDKASAAVNDKQLTATDGAKSQASNSFTVTANAVASVVFTTQPPGTVATGFAFPVAVTATDSGGNPVAGATVVLALSAGTGTLGGTLSLTTGPDGVASSNDLTIDKIGDKKIRATSGIATVETNPFTVVASQAASLSFTINPPSSVTSDHPFSVTVTVLDGSSNPSPNTPVTLTLNGVGSLSVAGVTRASVTLSTNSTGTVTFSGLSVDKAGQKFLTAAANAGTSNAVSTVSDQFTITPGSVTALTAVIPAAGDTLTATVNQAFSVQFQATDQEGNPVSSTVLDIGLSKADPTDATLAGVLNGNPSAVTDFQGEALFSTLSIDQPGGKKLTATVHGVSNSPSAEALIHITPQAANVAGLEPSSAVVDEPGRSPSFTLAIRGSFFAPTAEVYWDGVKVASKFLSPALITAEIPADTGAGKVDLIGLAGRKAVQVVNPGLTPATNNPGASQVFIVTTLRPQSSTHTLDSGLQFFSSPYDYPMGGPSAHIFDDILVEVEHDGSIRNFDPILAVWNPDPAKYGWELSSNPADDLAGHLRIGRGYWARFPLEGIASLDDAGQAGLAQRGPEASASSQFKAGSFEIDLLPGWNMIGDPFTDVVLMSHLRVSGANPGQEVDFNTAIDKGWIGGTFYSYPGSGDYTQVTDKLDPFVGYWVHAYAPCKLLVPKP